MSFLKIIRPFNCFFVALTVFAVAYYLKSAEHFNFVMFAALSATFIAAAGYVINDFFDIPIDKINKPDRILPSRKMKPETAYLYAVILFVAGILLSFLTNNIWCIGLAVFNSLLLFFYAKSYKKKPFSGNLVVAYTASSTFIYGGIANSNLQNSIAIALFAFLYTILREFIKDAEDIKGDSRFKAKTLAVILGRRKMTAVSFIPYSLIISLVFFLFFMNIISIYKLLLFLFLTIFPLLLFLISLLKSDKKRKYYISSLFMKLNMLLVLLIFFLPV